MQLTALLPVLLSTLSLTTAAPQGAPAVYKSNDLEIQGSPGGVAWRFDISAPKSENSPGFSTHCQGVSSNVTVCADKNITAQVRPLNDPNYNIWVQHHWAKMDGQYRQDFWQSGNVNVTKSTTRFQIKPDTFYGVA
ncbi:uncharacterized protein N7469_001653 [Penicillium citrinum]|uniref:Uncharacterized protein n=2 Tax=Penicillium TaxID=5073 RepID=A0A9W9TVX6_PENCI|nr:uncharacterized protein N7469_001653 [Penicillium citrinum]KAJ5243326.1 hypothetical protein N7469_001653 [Penicillium citrinum]KAJ5599171.1 hypothetical protein N7450_000238 [Penicillium hetheringtonii]